MSLDEAKAIYAKARTITDPKGEMFCSGLYYLHEDGTEEVIITEVQ